MARVGSGYTGGGTSATDTSIATHYRHSNTKKEDLKREDCDRPTSSKGYVGTVHVFASRDPGHNDFE